jgi:N-succinyldiaminopimelate aminotransferase
MTTSSVSPAARLAAHGGWRAVASDSHLLADDGSVAPTVFAEMSALAARTGSINLGQGFPDTDGPRSVLDGAVAAILGGANQYPPGRGTPELRRAVADHQRRFYGIEVDPETEVLITTGATEAIAASILAICETGDEVVVLEPFFDSYAAATTLAGAVRRQFPHYRLDADVLAAAFGPRTRAVLLNSPHNPTGRVLSRSELELVARLAVRHDAVVITDEVYEHLVFDGLEHVPMATLPGMAERTLTVSSAGKTFSVTGWKIGWVTGPAELVAAVTTVKQFLTYVSGGPLQPAVAGALALPDQTYRDVATRLQAGRDTLTQGLADAGFTVAPTSGTYFVVVDASPLGHPDGLELCRRLPELVGVVAIPLHVFYDRPESAGSLIRFAFCKRPEVISEAVSRLRRLRPA